MASWSGPRRAGGWTAGAAPRRRKVRDGLGHLGSADRPGISGAATAPMQTSQPAGAPRQLAGEQVVVDAALGYQCEGCELVGRNVEDLVGAPVVGQVEEVRLGRGVVAGARPGTLLAGRQRLWVGQMVAW